MNKSINHVINLVLKEVKNRTSVEDDMAANERPEREIEISRNIH